MVTEAKTLRGSLKEFGLVEILQMMGLGNMTGALHLHLPDRTGIIYFHEGALVTCSELTTEALTLGHVLQQLRMATAEQLDQAYSLQTQDPLGKRIGELLVEWRIISREQLRDALKTQVLWTIRELAQWREGTYEFLPGHHFVAEGQPLRIDVTRVVMEVLRYTQEWDELQSFLPDGMSTHLGMTSEIPQGPAFRFDQPTWQIITQINKRHTIRRIASAIRRPELDVARQAVPLIEHGLLRVKKSGSKPGLPQHAQRLSMESFDLFSLLSKIEQEWLSRRTPETQLIAFAQFINWTMDNLSETCEQNGISLAPDTLEKLLVREQLTEIDGYPLPLYQNHIVMEEFSQHCRQLFGARHAEVTEAVQFYHHASDVLQRALRAAFQAINARIASPIERMQNQETWEALFMGFQGEQPPE
ncbi:MAG TPA: DUF4388 domain-containing protein [Ktedonobacterales bacterium]|jgi:hypothetical protein